MVYLCDFHREQACERWVNKKDNGVSQQRDEILSRLRRITQTSTEKKCSDAVSALKQVNCGKQILSYKTGLKRHGLECQRLVISIIIVMIMATFIYTVILTYKSLNK